MELIHKIAGTNQSISGEPSGDDRISEEFGPVEGSLLWLIVDRGLDGVGKALKLHRSANHTL